MEPDASEAQGIALFIFGISPPLATQLQQLFHWWVF